LDAKGNPFLVQLDFENPVIVHFETKQVKEGENCKTIWKEVEEHVKKTFNRLKIVYSRAEKDKPMGELAISSHKVNAD